MDYLRQKARDHEMMSIPRSLANRLAGLDVVGSFPDIVKIARAADREVTEAGQVYFEVGTHLEFDSLREQARMIATESPWQRAALAGLVEDLFAYQGDITEEILSSSPNGDAQKATKLWMSSRSEALERAERLLTEIKGSASIDLSMLAVAARALRSLAH